MVFVCAFKCNPPAFHLSSPPCCLLDATCWQIQNPIDAPHLCLFITAKSTLKKCVCANACARVCACIQLVLACVCMRVCVWVRHCVCLFDFSRSLCQVKLLMRRHLQLVDHLWQIEMIASRNHVLCTTVRMLNICSVCKRWRC